MDDREINLTDDDFEERVENTADENRASTSKYFWIPWKYHNDITFKYDALISYFSQIIWATFY